jgi:class 3 adenylate cyclase/predicted ATPase
VAIVGEWLASLGLSEYAERFAENGIEIDVLSELTDQDLEKLGVLLGHRRRMLRSIRELGGTAAAAASAGSVAGPSAPEPLPRDTAERRQLTVMFVDLVGSTALSTRLDPEDLRAIINAYHGCCAQLVERNGGFVAKYMGDGVLAYFGYPRADEHDAERAVRAALALAESVPKLVTAAGSPLQARIGIATGLVVVGDLIGSGAAQEQAVVGETPNLAARLQALAEPGAVVISASTRRLTGGLFAYRDLGTVAVKGFGENVPAWQVTGAGAAESRFEALRGTTTPLVGREEEVELLMRRWQQAKAGDRQVVLICGEPGIGKSRIAQTVLERISGEAHMRLRYFCSPHHQDSALYPFIAQLERAAGLRREDTTEERLEKLEAMLAQATNDPGEAAPLLADLLSIPTGDRYQPLDLTPQKRKEKTLLALLAQLNGLSSRQPVLMLFEDVHWSDPTTRESLDLLVERVPKLRGLVVITFRPEFVPPWIGRPHVTMLTLNRLAPAQRAEMITQVTGGKTLPKGIVDQIVDRTDGVPLFIEELTKNVVESGVVTDAGDNYAISGPVGALAIPTSLQASLLARLDRLAPTREIAQIGAALGRSFSHELISAVAQMPEQKLNDAITQLVEAELIYRRGTPPHAEYTFKHALVQDAAYDTLLRSRRQQLHSRIAAVLETHFPEAAAARPELVAHHYTLAGIAVEAIACWLKAGQAALQRFALIEAISHVEKGMELLPAIADNTQRANLELGLQTTLAIATIPVKGYAAAEVERAYDRARVLCDQLGDSVQLFPVLYGLFVFHWVRGNLTTAVDGANEMLRIAEQSGDSTLLLIAHSALGNVLWHVGDNRTSIKHLQQAYARYDERLHAPLAFTYGNDFGVSTLCYMEYAQTSLGLLDQSLRSGLGAVALARRLNHSLSRCFAMGVHAGVMVLRHSDPVEILKLTDEYVSIAEDQGFPHWIAISMMQRGWAHARRGSVNEGVDEGNQGIAAWCATGAHLSLPFGYQFIAETQLAAEQPEAALAATDEALRWINRNSEDQAEPVVRCCRGDALCKLGNGEGAQAEYEAAIRVARQQDGKFWQLRAATGLARLWRGQGKRAEAHDLLAPVYGWFTEGFDTPVLKEAKTLLDELAA